MIPKRVADRLVKAIGKYQQVLKVAKDRDVNEADTVSIIKDMLSDIFGYDKYLEVTSEFQIRGTYCDLAIKIDNKVEFLIEVKAIGLDLKESHIRQAMDYGANLGVQWIVLTNGMSWQIYKIKYEQPINFALICTFRFDDLNAKDEEHQDKIFILCKEGLIKDAREEFHEKIMIVNRFMLGALILSDEIINEIRRELRKISDGVLVSPEEIVKILTNEVLKREIIEGDDAAKYQSRVRKFYAKAIRRPKETPTGEPIPEEPGDPQPQKDVQDIKKDE
jgi:predicted type IV restriction endonuclease